MKKMKRSLAVVLTLLLILQCVCAGVAAEATPAFTALTAAGDAASKTVAFSGILTGATEQTEIQVNLTTATGTPVWSGTVYTTVGGAFDAEIPVESMHAGSSFALEVVCGAASAHKRFTAVTAGTRLTTVETLRLSYGLEAGKLSVEGRLADACAREVSILLTKTENGKVLYLNQITADSDGAFSLLIPVKLAVGDEVRLQMNGESLERAAIRVFRVRDGALTAFSDAAATGDLESGEIQFSGTLADTAGAALTVIVYDGQTELWRGSTMTEESGAFSGKTAVLALRRGGNYTVILRAENGDEAECRVELTGTPRTVISEASLAYSLGAQKLTVSGKTEDEGVREITVLVTAEDGTEVCRGTAVSNASGAFTATFDARLQAGDRLTALLGGKLIRQPFTTDATLKADNFTALQVNSTQQYAASFSGALESHVNADIQVELLTATGTLVWSGSVKTDENGVFSGTIESSRLTWNAAFQLCVSAKNAEAAMVRFTVPGQTQPERAEIRTLAIDYDFPTQCFTVTGLCEPGDARELTILITKNANVVYVNQFDTQADGSFTLTIPASMKVGDMFHFLLNGKTITAKVERDVEIVAYMVQDLTATCAYSQKQIIVTGRVEPAIACALHVEAFRADNISAAATDIQTREDGTFELTLDAGRMSDGERFKIVVDGRKLQEAAITTVTASAPYRFTELAASGDAETKTVSFSGKLDGQTNITVQVEILTATETPVWSGTVQTDATGAFRGEMTDERVKAGAGFLLRAHSENAADASLRFTVPVQQDKANITELNIGYDLRKKQFTVNGTCEPTGVRELSVLVTRRENTMHVDQFYTLADGSFSLTIPSDMKAGDLFHFLFNGTTIEKKAERDVLIEQEQTYRVKDLAAACDTERKMIIITGCVDPALACELLVSVRKGGGLTAEKQIRTALDGKFRLELPEDGMNGGDRYDIVVSGAILDQPASTSVTVPEKPDTTIRDVQITADALDNLITVSGRLPENAGPDVTVTVRDAGGNQICSMTRRAEADGTFTIKISDAALKPDAKIGVTVRAAGADDFEGTAIVSGGLISATPSYDAAKDRIVLNGCLIPARHRELQLTVTDEHGRQYLLTVLADTDGSFYAELPTGVHVCSYVLRAEGYRDASGSYNSQTPTEPETGTIWPPLLGLLGSGEECRPFINGYQDGTFRPNRNISRGEAAAILARAICNGTDRVPQGYNASFSDVNDSAWYAASVGYLEALGVLKGTGSGYFEPKREVTRAEFTAMLVRCVRLTTYGHADFSDVPAGYWAAADIGTASANGLVRGYPDGTFRPKAAITRAEAVLAVYRMLKRSCTDAEAGVFWKTYSDVTPSHWAYMEILCGSNFHMHR